MKTLTAVFALCLTTVAANADCVLSDISGKWNATQWLTNARGAFFYRCPMRISSSGAIAQTTCQVSLDEGPPSIKDGVVTLRRGKTCEYRITYEIRDIVQEVEVTLSLDKSIGLGIGESADGPSMFQMVKQ